MVAYRVKTVILNPATDFLSFYDPGTGLSLTGTSLSSITVDANAYLISSDSGDGLALNNGPWSVSVLGAISAFETDQLGTFGAAIRISNSNAAPFPVSNISVAAGADVYGGRWGILAEAPTAINNAATITALTNSAIAELADGTVSIKNAGRIQALGTLSATDHTGSHAVYFAGAGTHSIINSGVIDGGNGPGAFAILATGASGVELLSNSGKIIGDVNLGGGADTVTMVKSGSIAGTVQMGDGNDRYMGGVGSETVIDGGGSDVVTFLIGGVDTYFAVTDVTTGADLADRIIGTGRSIYDASNATSDLKINLDKVAHNSIAARNATGTSIGTDVITGVTTVKSGNGNDEIWGTLLTETLSGGGGGDFIWAGLGNDTINGEAGEDSLYGGDGDDTINGGSDLDLIDGGNGNDKLDGGDGDDLVYGGSGNDRIVGGNGFDQLSGSAGVDVLDGGADADKLTGGLGKDYLTGGEANDTFTYMSLADSVASSAGRDVITDFEIGDRIDLSVLDANSKTVGVDDQFNWIEFSNFTKVAGQLRVGFSNGDTFIAGDVNGDAIADFQIQLTGHHLLLALDFVL